MSEVVLSRRDVVFFHRLSSFIESCKWLAFLVMGIHHYHLFVLGTLPGWVVSAGTIVFPLFTLSLVLACAHNSSDSLYRTWSTCLFWSGIALVVQLLVRETVPLNVLFTFAAAVFAFWFWVEKGSFWGLLLASPVAFFSEYSLVGYLFVFSALYAIRTGQNYLLIVPVALLMPQGFFQYSNFSALFLLPLVVGVLWFVPLRVPRVRGIFYKLYALQYLFFFVVASLTQGLGWVKYGV